MSKLEHLKSLCEKHASATDWMAVHEEDLRESFEELPALLALVEQMADALDGCWDDYGKASSAKRAYATWNEGD